MQTQTGILNYYVLLAFAWQGELTDTAKYHRLRRLCEKKRSGKLLVPEQVVADYKAGGAARQKLMDQLGKCGCSKEL